MPDTDIDLSAGLEPAQSSSQDIDLSAGLEPAQQSQAAPTHPNIDMSTVAGAVPGTPSPMQAAGQVKNAATADRPVSGLTRYQAVTHLADFPTSRAQEQGIDAGLSQALTGGNPEHPIEGQFRELDPILASAPVGAYETGAGLKDAAKGIINRDANATARGGTRALQGAMEAGTIPMRTGVAQAPLRMGLGYLEAVAAGKSAEYAAKQLGLSPDEQEFANTVGTFLPMPAGMERGHPGARLPGAGTGAGPRGPGATAVAGDRPGLRDSQ